MKNTMKNEIRTNAINAIMAYFLEAGEDVSLIASNTLNFPIVKDGEEAWIEVTVKIPKESGNDGYMKRESYEMHLKEMEDKKKEKGEAKAKKKEEEKG